MKAAVEDYCEEEQITSLDELCKGFGSPQDVISSYYATVDTDYIIKRISISRAIKRGIAILVILFIIGTSIRYYQLYNVYQVFKEESVFFEETVIE